MKLYVSGSGVDADVFLEELAGADDPVNPSEPPPMTPPPPPPSGGGASRPMLSYDLKVAGSKLLHCPPPLDTYYAMCEVHGGRCRTRAARLAQQAHRFFVTMADARD